MARYRLLETVRQYAARAAGGGGRGGGGAGAAPGLVPGAGRGGRAAPDGPEQATWLARLEAEHDNLRAALGWATQAGDSSGGAAAGRGALALLVMRGHLSEGRGWLEALLAHAGATDEPAGLRAAP